MVKTEQKQASSVWLTSYDFLDGLGRKVQSSSLSPTPSGVSVRAATAFDASGRAYQVSAPFESTSR